MRTLLAIALVLGGCSLPATQDATSGQNDQIAAQSISAEFRAISASCEADDFAAAAQHALNTSKLTLISSGFREDGTFGKGLYYDILAQGTARYDLPPYEAGCARYHTPAARLAIRYYQDAYDANEPVSRDPQLAAQSRKIYMVSILRMLRGKVQHPSIEALTQQWQEDDLQSASQ